MNTLTTGDMAPRFTLTNQHGAAINLSDKLSHGPVLVYFYPKAMTPGCTVQACGLNEVLPQLA
ncbi:MAG: redoxin domain-containing protein, partial [Shewanella sp.]